MMKNLLKLPIIIILILLIGLTACSPLPEANIPGTGISKVALPETHGLSSAKLEDAITNIKQDYPAIRSVHVIKDSTLLFEWYRQGVNPDEIVEVHSGAKIVTSLLTGVAIDKGYLKDENVTIGDVYSQINPDEVLHDNPIYDVTVDSLLKMNSGIVFSDAYLSIPIIKERSKNNFNAFSTVLKLQRDANAEFEYITENYVTVNAIIGEVSGMSDYDFVTKYIFEPLSISSFAYTADFIKMGDASRDLFLRPIDYAKIGILVMNRGVYEGRRIVSSEWVDKCTSTQIRGQSQEQSTPNILEFGYGVWRTKYNGIDIVYTYGKNGQYLLMIPEKDLLIVTTANEKRMDLFYRDKLLEWFLESEIEDGI